MNGYEQAFWEGGYDATSMTDLLSRMGIQKGSFYDTFGSKHAVLLETLESYVAGRFSEFQAHLRAESPRAALEEHLRAVATDACGSGRGRGCYLVNAALELSTRDPAVRAVVLRALAAHERHYVTLLEAAREKREVQPALDVVATARGMMGLVIGMRVLARAGAPQAVIETIREQALAMLGDKVMS